MTSGSATRRLSQDPRRQNSAQTRATDARRTPWGRVAVVFAVVAVLAAVVAAMLLTSRSTTTQTSAPAPSFTLPSTDGAQVSLSDFRGRPVLLYFSEGAGCGSCLQQMAAIEQQKARFDKAGVTVLPIVINSREQIMADMSSYGVTTPFLLDDGTVSTAYKTIGRGMHAGLPGHSFVLVDATGTQRWHGEYPSMWLAPDDLLSEVTKRL